MEFCGFIGLCNDKVLQEPIGVGWVYCTWYDLHSISIFTLSRPHNSNNLLIRWVLFYQAVSLIDCQLQLFINIIVAKWFICLIINFCADGSGLQSGTVGSPAGRLHCRAHDGHINHQVLQPSPLHMRKHSQTNLDTQWKIYSNDR